MSLVYPGLPVGVIMDFPGPIVPPLWLECQAQSLLRASYVALFNALCANKGAFTVTLATPGVFTSVAHGLKVGDAVFLETTGTLPTGLVADTSYYVNTVPTADTFTLGTGRTVPINGSITGSGQITTSVSQSGVHSLFHAPYLVADATHFTLPSLGQWITPGQSSNAAGVFAVLGAGHGELTHTLLSTESGIPDHTHGNPNTGQFITVYNGVNQDHIFQNTAGATWGTNSSLTGAMTGGAASAGSAHNNVQSGTAVKKIIYAGI